MTLSKLDHKKRSRGVGSSEIGMLVYVPDSNGDMKPLSPYGGAHKLWRRKTGKEEWKPARSYMQRGIYLETGVINWYADDHGVVWHKPSTIVHSTYPYVVDSVDGLEFPKGTSKTDMKRGLIKPIRCIEAKALTGWNTEGFGQAETDEIPDNYLVQCAWHIGAHEPEDMSCAFPVDLNGRRVDYMVRHDEELYMSLVMRAEKFWQDYVLKDVEPPIDDYADTTSWLSKYLRQRDGLGLLEADDEQIKLLLRYHRISGLMSKGKERLEVLKEKLMRDIGEHDGIVLPDNRKAKIWWKRPKDSAKIDWKAIAEQLAQRLRVDGNLPRENFDAMKADYTTMKKGSRAWKPASLITHAGNGQKDSA